MSDERIQITGQCVDIRRLKATGGWRFSIDLFDALEKDVLLAASLVNRQQTVILTVEPYEKAEEKASEHESTGDSKADKPRRRRPGRPLE